MSAAEIPVDVDVLREEIRKTYTDVSTDQEQEFIFPTGRAWAQELGLPAALASCIASTIRTYAHTKQWTVGELSVDVVYDHTSTPRHFDVTIHLPDDLSDEQVRRIMRAAETCPVRRAIEAGITFDEHLPKAQLETTPHRQQLIPTRSAA